MKASLTSGITIRHQHGAIGPDSRSHSHAWKITISYESTFDAKSGEIRDFLSFKSIFDLVIAAYDGLDLHEIDGIRPTMESLALRIREDMLSSFPNPQRSPLHVSIFDGNQLMVEAP